MAQDTLISTLKSYVPSFLVLIVFAMAYSVLVFNSTSQSYNHNFTVAKKLKAEKLSLETVVPVRDVASPLETE